VQQLAVSPAVLYPVRPEVEEEGGAAEAVRENAYGVPWLEGDEEEEAMEEAVVAKPAKDPHAPTHAEREAHEATHLPFRSWCAECVSGRRDNPPHLRREPEERVVPEIMLDYAFIRRQDEVEKVTVLLMKDRESRAIRAWTMRHKGVSYEEAALRTMDGIKALGHNGKILVKVDNEPALQALRDEVLRLLGSTCSAARARVGVERGDRERRQGVQRPAEGPSYGPRAED
jgi:hypothetical protein